MAEITKELGRIPVSRGNYQSTTEYYKDNIVQYKRGSYQVVSESPIIGISPTNDKNIVNPGWTLFAGTLDAQDVVNQIKEQEAQSIQAVADREAEILTKSDASNISSSAIGLEGSNVEDKLTNASNKLSELETKVVQLKNAGYLYAGIATPTTNPGTPEGPVFYIANGKGTYTNFGGINVTEDEVVVLYYDTIWHKEKTGIASNNKLTELSEKMIAISGGITLNKSLYNSNGSEKLDVGFYITPFISVTSSDYISVVISPSITSKYLVLYDESYQVVTFFGLYSDRPKIILSEYPTVAYVRTTFKIGEGGEISINGTLIWDNSSFKFPSFAINTNLLQTWILADTYIPSNIVRDEDGNVKSCDVTWSDGVNGSMNISRDSIGNVMSVTATYNGKTYVLTITRDSDGNVKSTNIK